MSGIGGIWNLDGRPVDDRLLARLSATLAHRGPDGEGRWIDGPVGLICQALKVTPESLHETQPVVRPSGTVVVFDGRLDDRNDLRALVDDHANATISVTDAELVAAAYDAFGESFLKHLNGDFALALFDGRRRTLILARDAIGLRPLYYHRTGETILFASEIKFILAHPETRTQPNGELLADFFMGGRCQQNVAETFFEGVQRVPAGHRVTVTAERAGVLVHRFWDFDPARLITFGSLDDYAEAFRHYFQAAVSRRLRSAHPVAISLSGGLDSSSIFCVAENLSRHAPESHAAVSGVSQTFDDGSPCDEGVFLAEIEREYSVKIDRVPMGPPGFMEDHREAIRHAESPLLDRQGNATRQLYRRVSTAGAKTLLTGNWGDELLFDSTYLVDLARRLAWDDIRAHLKEFPEWCPDVDPKYFVRRFIEDLARAGIPAPLLPVATRMRNMMKRPDDSWKAVYTREFEAHAVRFGRRTKHAVRRDGSAHFRSLHGQLRSGYTSLWLEWTNHAGAMHGIDVAFPFLDRDFVAFLMAVPGERVTSNGVPKGLLRESMRNILPASIAARRGKADFTHRINQGVDRDYVGLRGVLESDETGARRGYVNNEEVIRFVESMGKLDQNESCVAAWRVIDMVGLVLWLQVFFGEPSAAK